MVAKPGLDGHDRGAKVVARALRDAGMEVIYTGLHQTPGADRRDGAGRGRRRRSGCRCSPGAHLTLFARVLELLAAEDASDIVVFGGGIIPAADRAELLELGVAQVFTPGATMADIVAWVRGHVGREPLAV